MYILYITMQLNFKTSIKNFHYLKLLYTFNKLVSVSLTNQSTQACSAFFHQGRYHCLFFWEGQKYFHLGQKFICVYFQYHWRQNRQADGAEYLIITNEGLVFESVPYTPNESFFIRGKKLYFEFHQRHMPHGSTRLCVIYKERKF